MWRTLPTSSHLYQLDSEFGHCKSLHKVSYIWSLISGPSVIYWDKLQLDHSLGKCTRFLINNLMELLRFCMQITNFQLSSILYQQEEDLPMESLLSPGKMKYFDEIIIEISPLKLTIWMRYVYDTFIHWP